MFMAVVQQQYTVPESSWAGITTMAGLGLVLLVISFLSIKGRVPEEGGEPKQMLLWGGMIAFIMKKIVEEPTKRISAKWEGTEGFDWRSLMTFLVGVLGVTMILSSTGQFLMDFAVWLQGMIRNLENLPVTAEVGSGGLCLLLLFLAMRGRGDDMKDLTFGMAAGLIFPLGGGKFAEVTLKVGQWAPELFQIS